MIQIAIQEIDAAMSYLDNQAAIEEHPEWGIASDPNCNEVFDSLKGHFQRVVRLQIGQKTSTAKSPSYAPMQHEKALSELLILASEMISAELTRQKQENEA